MKERFGFNFTSSHIRTWDAWMETANATCVVLKTAGTARTFQVKTGGPNAHLIERVFF